MRKIVILRQEVDPSHHQDKAIGESLPVDENSKTRIAGQLRRRLGPAQTTHFSILVTRPPQLDMCRKAPWRSKRRDAK